ncbi:MAG: tRNA (guanosine(37)-N1)-methyltransferase TrmD [Anaerolineae bacterium]|nr:tRNA (guanosine(37)-N1)-methyltransferase TrmD [Anaerolineae bacterium]
MRIDIYTLFPSMFSGPLQESILKRAQQRGLLNIIIHQIRDYAFDRHQMTDDAPYGGGEGMLLKPEPIIRAIECTIRDKETPIILLTPQGKRFDQTVAETLAQQPAIALLCGRYEGVDERVRQLVITDEISIGDYVMTGGELAAMVVVDAVARFLPGVLGAEHGAEHDSFASGLLEGPQYTRPAVFRTMEVPAVLRSGNHAAIDRWKADRAQERTKERRSDLIGE